jgi:hypothetical protein
LRLSYWGTNYFSFADVHVVSHLSSEVTCADWSYGLPLIVLNVVIHVLGLGLINQKAIRVASGAIACRHPTSAFVLVMGTTTLLATILHWIEVAIWATAYRLLGALPDLKSAMLYSLNAVTSYGHANLSGIAIGLKDSIELL